jgi:hypothetical protein
MQIQSQYGAAALQVLHVQVLLGRFCCSIHSGVLHQVRSSTVARIDGFDHSCDAVALLIICFPNRLAGHSFAIPAAVHYM